MGIVNRRNALLGWGVWKLGKTWGVWKFGKDAMKNKAKKSAPSVEAGRPNKQFVAVALAGAVGALTFWRKHRGSGESPS